MTQPPRLHILLARKAPRAVVIRRGPSKQVELILWHTDTDRFFFGQWLKGRIYEQRCDLSPSGERLIYFAASHRPPFYSWTAVSRPPYWTAVALWPKGDCWFGGGFFADENHIELSGSDGTKMADGFQLPRHIVVSALVGTSCGNIYEPVESKRLLHGGWRLARAKPRSRRKPSMIWEKPSPLSKGGWLLQHDYICRQCENGRNAYVFEYVVLDRNEEPLVSLGPADWADWDRNGDLLFAKEGRLFRLMPQGIVSESPLAEAEMLVDLCGQTFYPLAPSEEAKGWSAPIRLDDLRA